jgi:hypothetical protein
MAGVTVWASACGDKEPPAFFAAPLRIYGKTQSLPSAFLLVGGGGKRSFRDCVPKRRRQLIKSLRKRGKV